jgi:hypothetical protein
MSRRKQTKRSRIEKQKRQAVQLRQNKTIFGSLLEWLVPKGELFTEDRFHGNIKWTPEQLSKQALIWSWQEAKNVTDAFAITEEICKELRIEQGATSYTGFMDALDRYGNILSRRLTEQTQILAEELAGRFWRDDDWVLMGFDGSRATTPRTVSNEKEFCAPNYGNGQTARYRKKQTQGMRRRQNEKNKPQPQAPQAWITMMWHMGLRLPWTWRLGPSNSSERGHVVEMLKKEKFPKNTLFCGDAGFVGYPLWSAIMAAGGHFLVRVGGNVKLLTDKVDIEKCAEGTVLCWPKGQMNSGALPLKLRLVQVKIGKTKMWMLTNVLSRKKLPKKKIVKYYKMRWGVEVEFRGLKQTLDKTNLRCRNSDRVYAELDWSIRAMAMAELMALREQISDEEKREEALSDYDTKERSLANIMRTMRKCMRNLNKYADTNDDLLHQLADALVQKYHSHTDKKSRYRPKNPDKKPLGEPTVTQLDRKQREKLKQINQQVAA